MQNIEDICHSYPLNRKWLIVPSVQIGNSWLEYFVRLGGSHVNVQPVTVEQFATELASVRLANDNRRRLPKCLASVIVQLAWELLPASGDLRGLQPSAELFSGVARAIDDLRRQDICHRDLRTAESRLPDSTVDDFEVLLKAWQDYLDEHRLADDAMILGMAVAAVSNGELPKSDVILLPEHSAFFGLEAQLLRALPDAQVVEMESPLLLTAEGDDDGDFGLNLFRATDAASEVGEVIRRCVDDELPLDCVELLHTDAATYVPLLVEFAELASPNDEPLQITFEDGLPVGASRPFRAFRGWLRWISDDYSPKVIEQLYVDDLLPSGPHANVAVAAALNSLNLNGEHKDLIERLNQHSDALEIQLEQLRASGDTDPTVIASHQAEQDKFRVLARTISQLTSLAVAINGSDGNAAESAVVEFFLRYAKPVSAFDRLVCREVVEEIGQQYKQLKSLGLEFNVRRWLEALGDNLTVCGSGPKPGMLHVASLATGGQSGRPLTFIVGLDERRFPGDVLHDDVLPDSLRRLLGETFPTHEARRESLLFGIQQMLSQLRGELTVSWSCGRSGEGGEVGASPLIHKLGQMMLGTAQAECTAEQLSEIAGEPISVPLDNE